VFFPWQPALENIRLNITIAVSSSAVRRSIQCLSFDGVSRFHFGKRRRGALKHQRDHVSAQDSPPAIP
jgi:hypothetical protein